MKDILIDREDMKAILTSAIKKDLSGDGYSSPTRNVVSGIIEDVKPELQTILREVLQEVILDAEFKKILKLEFKHKVAKMLVGDLSGSVEKAVNEFRQDPRLRADMIQAIERIIEKAKG